MSRVNMMDASTAATIATNVENRAAEFEMAWINTMIETAAEKGDFSVDFKYHLAVRNTRTLEAKGFDVLEHHNGTRVSW